MDSSSSAGAVVIGPYCEVPGQDSKKERGPGEREGEKSSCNKTSISEKNSSVDTIAQPLKEEDEEEAKDGFVIPELNIGTQRKHITRRNTVMTVSGTKDGLRTR